MMKRLLISLLAAINGELIFQPVEERRSSDSNRPMLQIANYLRDGAIIQRDAPLPIWGHANAGAKVTVILGGKILESTANELGQWSVSFPPMKESATPITLNVSTSLGMRQEVSNILIGDVWFLTGANELTGEMAYDSRDKDAKIPTPLPLMREFRRKTKASTNPTPRTRYFETGGGRFRSPWITADFAESDDAVTMFAYHFAKTLNRPAIPQGFISMSSGNGGSSPQFATPLSWIPLSGVSDLKDPTFQARVDELMLQYPYSPIARKALEDHISEVKAAIQTIHTAQKNNADLSKSAPLRFPGFPEPGKNPDVAKDMLPTLAYNWCVSPFVPVAVAGVIWVPSTPNIGPDPKHYAAELEIYARSLPETYGSKDVPFIYAQPDASLVEGITTPKLPKATAVNFNTWPKSLKGLAIEMAKTVK